MESFFTVDVRIAHCQIIAGAGISSTSFIKQICIGLPTWAKTSKALGGLEPRQNEPIFNLRGLMKAIKPAIKSSQINGVSRPLAGCCSKNSEFDTTLENIWTCDRVRPAQPFPFVVLVDEWYVSSGAAGVLHSIVIVALRSYKWYEIRIQTFANRVIGWLLQLTAYRCMAGFQQNTNI